MIPQFYSLVVATPTGEDTETMLTWLVDQLNRRPGWVAALIDSDGVDITHPYPRHLHAVPD